MRTPTLGRFVEAGFVAGIDFDHDGRAVAPLDADGDGDLDLVVLSLQGLKLLLNAGPPAERHWLQLRLRGTRGEPHALGTVVTVTAGGRTQVDRVRLTAGFHTQVSPDVHVGLGDATKVDRVEVRWPSGQVQRWSDLPADTRLLLVEGKAEATPLPRPPWPPDSIPLPHADFDLAVPVQHLDGHRLPLGRAGRPTVVNFWAPWCEGCKKELPGLVALHGRRGDEVDFVGVSVETKQLDDVRAFVRQYGVRYPVRLATDEVVRAFFGDKPEITLPVTFVFDAEGRLERSFFREIGPEELDALLDGLVVPPSAQDLFALAIVRSKEGRNDLALEALQKAADLEPESAAAHWRLGVVALQAGQAARAEAALRRAVKLLPEDHEAWTDLGRALVAQGRLDDAEAAVRRALEIAPDSARALTDLANLQMARADYEGAIASLRAAAKTAPEQPVIWSQMARAQQRLGRTAEAQKSLQRARELVPGVDAAAPATVPPRLDTAGR